jgi:TonB family protein
MKTLDSIQNELRELIVQGSDLALAALKKILQPGTGCYDDLLNLEGRYQQITKQLLQGVVSQEDADLEFNRIRQSLIEFVGCLNESDIPELKSALEKDGNDIADIYNGEVLYRIPKQMQLGVEEECIVRLAFDRKVLIQDFEVEVGDVMKDLRIAEVMGVELIDPAADKAFSITTFNDTVQYVDKRMVTEWIFNVTPLKEGAFPLVLKISIVEIINGIERKRNEVLKEQVQILTQKPEAATTDFVSTGYGWQVTKPDEKRAVPIQDIGGRAVPEVSPAPPSPAPQVPKVSPPSPNSPAPPPSLPGAKKSAGLLGFAGKVLAAAVVLVIGGVTVSQFFPGPNPPIVLDDRAKKLNDLRSKPNRQELEAFVQANPGTVEATTAASVLDSLENAVWNSALASDDQAAMEDYLANYPAGKYSGEAAYRIDEINRGVEAFVEAPADTIVEVPIEKLPEDKPNNLVPAPQKKPVKPKPAPVPGKKPQTKPTVPVKPTADKPTPIPTDPNAPVAMVSAARPPVFKKCSKSNKEKEAQCTTDKIRQFLQSRIEYPKAALDKGIHGTVVVSFVVERDGSISEVKALNDIGGGCGKEAMRLIKALPRFKPGLNAKGEPIRVQYTQPVTFKLN